MLINFIPSPSSKSVFYLAVRISSGITIGRNLGLGGGGVCGRAEYFLNEDIKKKDPPVRVSFCNAGHL